VNGSDDITEPGIIEVRHTADGVEIDLMLPDDLFYFRGHFPGRPILPGVVQIDWAVRFADRYLNIGIGSAQNFQVKFTSIIEPEQPVTMVLQRSADGKSVRFKFQDKSTILSSGSIRLEAPS
jgi:3-hydroxymyristoyl/3-hydroxydecanoyl-(acyl carrier protein) dehydratase